MITYAGATLLANYFCGKTSSGNPLWVGLSTSAPTVAGANYTEPSANTYARVQLCHGGNSSVKNFFGSPVQGENGTVTISNNSTVYFPETWNTATEVGEDWGNCTYVCLFSSGTKGAGSLLAYQQLTTAIHPGENNASTIPIIRVGDITLSFGNPVASN